MVWVAVLFRYPSGGRPPGKTPCSAQVVDVIARKHDLDAVDEAVVRARVLADDVPFFRQVDFGI
jgi:hypothetical protein